MSFNLNGDNLNESAEQVEINRQVNDKVKNGRATQEVEIFTDIVYGKDVSKYGKKVDTVMESMKNLAKSANEGNLQAKAELNAVRTITIKQPLEKRLSINEAMGNVNRVGMNEELRYEVYQLQGEKSREQASSGSFVFPTVKKRTGIMETKTATGGVIVDYRELASGATDGMAVANEQVITDMINKMVLSNLNALRTAITNATTLRNYAEGITKTNVDTVKKLARRFSQNGVVSILGDYSAISMLGDLAYFPINTGGTEFRFSQAVMDEVMKTGLLKLYNGSPVIELPNSYNLTDLNVAENFYSSVLPESDLWIVPQGVYSPLQIGIKSGITSMTATDINLRAEVTRYDLEFGNYVIPEYIPMVGYINDPSLDA